MAQKGIDKQNPPDQRGRGLNPQHKEGQANLDHQEKQKATQPSPPAPQTGSGS